MPFSPFGRAPLFGLDIGSSMVKAIELRRQDGRLVAERAAIASLPGGAVSGGLFLDPFAAGETIRNLCREHGFRSRRVAVCVTGEEVLVTRVRVETRSQEVPAELVKEEAARRASFSLDDALLDYQVMGSPARSGFADVLVVAAKRPGVDRLRELLLHAGKTVTVVDSAACALANSFEFNYEPAASEAAVLVHLGASILTLCIVRGAMPLLARDIALPMAPFSRDRDSLIQRVAVELERVLEEMDEIAGERPLEPRSSQLRRIVLSGGGARLRGLDDLLRSRTGLPVEVMNPFRRIDFTRTDAASRLVWDHVHCMPIAVGLAMRGYDPD